jgi:hypothetical protein
MGKGPHISPFPPRPDNSQIDNKVRQMQERLKRWESPRKQGRNDKGKGGSARARQLKKQTQMLRRKLKEGSPKSSPDSNGNSTQNNQKKTPDSPESGFFMLAKPAGELLAER